MMHAKVVDTSGAVLAWFRSIGEADSYVVRMQGNTLSIIEHEVTEEWESRETAGEKLLRLSRR